MENEMSANASGLRGLLKFNALKNQEEMCALAWENEVLQKQVELLVEQLNEVPRTGLTPEHWAVAGNATKALIQAVEESPSDLSEASYITKPRGVLIDLVAFLKIQLSDKIRQLENLQKQVSALKSENNKSPVRVEELSFEQKIVQWLARLSGQQFRTVEICVENKIREMYGVKYYPEHAVRKADETLLCGLRTTINLQDCQIRELQKRIDQSLETGIIWRSKQDEDLVRENTRLVRDNRNLKRIAVVATACWVIQFAVSIIHWLL